MTRLGLIAGSAHRNLLSGKDGKTEMVSTPFGETSLWTTPGLVFSPRHGMKNNIPPHRINHQATMSALKKLGILQVLGINSTGSLRRTLPPGSLVVPHDYINPWGIQTIYHDEICHITPGLDEGMRVRVLTAAKQTGTEVVAGGVYIQTTGPRLETKAEIDMLKIFGDVVGMTMANEATIARELGLAYASICTVDNFCHGITDTPLSQKEILEAARQNVTTLRRLIQVIVEKLG